jgi:hypothetical protein
MSDLDDGGPNRGVQNDGEDDDVPGVQSSIGPSGINPQAMVGVLLCALAVILVGVVLTHTAFKANDLPAAVTPPGQVPSGRVTAVARVHPVTPVKKAPRTTVTAPTSIPAPVTSPVTVPVVSVQTPPRHNVVRTQTVVTQPPAPPTPVTQPQQIQVPYTPPTAPPPGIPVPFNPSTPSG